MEFIFGKQRFTSNDKEKNNDRNNQQLEKEDTDNAELEAAQSRNMALKSGFLSIKDRMSSLAQQSERNVNYLKVPTETNASNSGRKERLRQNVPQFATLQELFSSRLGKTNGEKSCLYSNSSEHTKKIKMPIMKLTKDDWNVKCWEERLGSQRRRQPKSASTNKTSQSVENRAHLKKPERQIEVFRGRIDEVAMKLEKVREGALMDEELFRLEMFNSDRGNRSETNKKGGSSHEWTDLLKRELQSGLHNPKQLRSELASIGNCSSANNDSRSIAVKSPLGRPVRKIFQDTDEESDD